MAYLGIPLENDTLVITKGRDWRWQFQNLDSNDQPEDFPEGELFLEFQTGGAGNAKQTITILRAAGGTYTLDLPATSPTGALDWDSSELAVQNAIETLVGVGNVKVTGSYVPQWIIEVDWTSPVDLSPGVVQTFNQTINAVFDALEGLGAGKIDLNGVYGASSFTLTATYRGSLLEEEIIEFILDSVESLIDTALDAVELFTGNVGNVDEFYAPKRIFKVEFIGDLALTPVDTLIPVSSLTGSSPTIAVTAPGAGRAPVTVWEFVIDGDTATIKVESEEADLMPARTVWQLVFLPEGEAEGGDPIATGTVQIQGAAR